MTVLQESPSPEKPGAATVSTGGRKETLAVSEGTLLLVIGSLTWENTGDVKCRAGLFSTCYCCGEAKSALQAAILQSQPPWPAEREKRLNPSQCPRTPLQVHRSVHHCSKELRPLRRLRTLRMTEAENR